MKAGVEVNENNPLLEKKNSSQLSLHGGNASFQETVVNLMKLCMGTGTLALPFAAQKGGLILNVFGLLGIVVWNLFSISRLIAALLICENNNLFEKCPQEAKKSIFSKVAWLAFGEFGVHMLDVCLVTLFWGIIVSYEDAAIGFLQDTSLSTLSSGLDAFIMACIVGILSLVPEMKYLAKVSASGLFVLASTFIIVAIYGTTSGKVSTSALNLWPAEDVLTSVSNWFGCVVFGFGTVPFTYSYYESMKEPSRLFQAKTLALSWVLLSYFVLGYGFLLLYPVVMDGDILKDLLPTTGAVPTIVRLAMVVVIIFTSPLIVLPCGLILEGKISEQSSKILQIAVRSSICITSAAVSILVPGFVYILSFVGCCAVSLVSFVVPPLIHITLVLKYENISTNITTVLFDFIMIVCGVFAMIISSTLTFKKLYNY